MDKIFWAFVGIWAFQLGQNWVKKQSQKLAVKFTGVKFANRDGLKLLFNVGLDIENKNNFSIPNLVFRGGIHVKNKPLIPLGLSQRVTIPKNGKVHIDLLLPIDHMTVLNLWAAFPEMKKSLSLNDFRLIGDILMLDDKGEVVIGTSINESFTIELKKLW